MEKPGEYLVTQLNGREFRFQTNHGQYSENYWTPVLEEVGVLKYIADDVIERLHKPHDCRHTFTSMWKTQKLDEAGYTGAVKPPVRRTGNRKSGPEETGIYAAEPPSRRNSFPGWGRQLIGYIIRSVPDPVRIPLSWSGSWQDRSERC